jgi:uncharacterized protein (TIGR02246 family)
VARGADLDALAQRLEDHVAAVNAGNVDALLEHFADDVVYLSQGLAPVIGKTALEAMVRPFYATNQPTITMTAEDRGVDGNLAWEWGVGSGEIRSKSGGDPTPMRFKYFLLYRREPDGQWRLISDVTNDDAPKG